MGTLLKNDLDINCISVLVLVLKHLEFTFSTENNIRIKTFFPKRLKESLKDIGLTHLVLH